MHVNVGKIMLTGVDEIGLKNYFLVLKFSRTEFNMGVNRSERTTSQCISSF